MHIKYFFKKLFFKSPVLHLYNVTSQIWEGYFYTVHILKTLFHKNQLVEDTDIFELYFRCNSRVTSHIHIPSIKWGVTL